MIRWVIIAPVATACSMLLAACGGGGAPAPTQSDDAGTGDIPVVEVSARWASANARDLAALIGFTGTVFVGKVEAKNGQRLEDTIPPGPVTTGSLPDGKPASRSGPPPFPISLFNVKVERPLLGGVEEGSTIVVEQAGGVSERSDGTKVLIRLESNEPLEVGATYMFFASPTPNGNGNYVSPPFGRLKVDANGNLTAPAAWGETGALKQLSGRGLDDAAISVAQAGGR